MGALGSHWDSWKLGWLGTKIERVRLMTRVWRVVGKVMSEALKSRYDAKGESRNNGLGP